VLKVSAWQAIRGQKKLTIIRFELASGLRSLILDRSIRFTSRDDPETGEEHRGES